MRACVFILDIGEHACVCVFVCAVNVKHRLFRVCMKERTPETRASTE